MRNHARLFAPHFARLIAVALCFGAPSAFSQFSSAVEGTITDTSGASVPNATVTLINVDTNQAQTATTSSGGYYRFNALNAANFRITATAPGLQTIVQEGIRLEVSKVTTINLTLPVGSTRAEVVVTSEPPPIQTAEANVSGLISQQEVRELPLVGRNFYTLVVLEPGVTGLPSGGGQAYAQASADIFNGEYGVNMNAGGLRSEQNGFTVDGVSVVSMVRHGVANIDPNADAVQELRVTVNDFAAQFGGAAGARTDVVTRSGSNQLHGAADWFHTDNALQARNEFQPSVPSFKRNEFAGSLGGAAVKDKTFLFGTIDVLRSSAAFSAPTAVYTQDFLSFLKTNLPNNVSTGLLNSYPSLVTPTSSFTTVGSILNSPCSGAAPIATPAGPMPCNLQVTGVGNLSLTTPRNGFQWGGRVDQVLGSKDRLYGAVYRTSVQDIWGGVPSAYAAFTSPGPEYTLYVHLNETHTFSPNFLNEFNASFVRLHGDIPCEACNIPVLDVTGVTQFGDANGPVLFIQNNFEYNDQVTIEHGAHSLHVGFDFQKLQSNYKPTEAYTRPQFYFLNPLYVAADQPYSEFNFGFNPVTGSRDVVDVAERQPLLGLYIQDTWKLKSNLTLNLGLRWDSFGKVSEATQVTNLEFPNAPDYTSRLAGAKSVIVPTILNNLRLGNLGPRASIAWDPTKTGRMSVRAGFGRFYDVYTAQVYGGSHFNPPLYAFGYAAVNVPDGPQPNFGAGTSATYPFDFPYPTGIQLGLNAQGGLASGQVNVSATDPNLPTSYTQNWFFGIQGSLSPRWIVEANYVGDEGHHLYANYDVNRFAGDLIENAGNLTRINKSFGAIGYAQANMNSFYEGANFSIRHVTSKGLTVQVGYTFGHAIDDMSGFGGNLPVLEVANIARERASSDYDVRHKVAASLVYTVPNPNTQSGLVNHVVAGWQLSNTTILQSGTPFTVYCSVPFLPVFNATHQVVGNTGCDYNADGFNYDVPNAPSFGTQNFSRQRWLSGVFTAAQFPAPALGQEGNLGRNTYVGPGFANSDLGLSRNFGIPWFHDRHANFEFRAEAFNFLNRVNLTGVVSDTSSPLFGKATSTFGARDFQFGARFSF